MVCSTARRLRWTAGSFLFFLACAKTHEGISIASAQDISDINPSENNYERKERAKDGVRGDGLHKQRKRPPPAPASAHRTSPKSVYYTQGLSGPVAMGDAPGTTGESRVFVVYNGHLHQLKKNVAPGGTTPLWTWTDHSHPNFKLLTPKFAPGGVVEYFDQTGRPFFAVFAVDSWGNLWKLPFSGLTGNPLGWVDHGSMSGTYIKSGISAIQDNRYLWFISDGFLYKHDIETKLWFVQPSPTIPGLNNKSTPLVLGNNHVFCVGSNGKLYEYWNQWVWVSHGKPASGSNGKIRLCGAAMEPSNKIFCTTNGGNFFQFWWSSTSGWQWHNHGSPAGLNGPNPYAETGTPTTLMDGKLHVTVHLNFNSAHLVELYWETSAQVWSWYDHGYSGALELFTDPDGMSSDNSFISKNLHVLERRFVGGQAGWVWIDHGEPQ